MPIRIRPVILCGGSGTRLWPLSSAKHPKQFLSLTSSKSMIEETQSRFEKVFAQNLEFAETLVVGSQRHTDLLHKALPKASMILEPFGRNSAPAVAAACLACEPDELLLILPADHSIQNIPAFQAAISLAAEEALQAQILTFGIQPTFAATGYGYLHAPGTGAEARPVLSFTEKPTEEVAEGYLEEGHYLWNAGIFLFQAKTMLEALSDLAPEILSRVEAAMSGHNDPQKILLDKAAFRQAPDISIDYAVMERAHNVKTVPVDMGWSDVGDYYALWKLFSEADGDNVLAGPVHVRDGSGIYARSEGPVVAVSGVQDLNIIATPHAVMVSPKRDAFAVKQLGQDIQHLGAGIGISAETRQHAKAWLWSAFDHWAKVAWDDVNGGFVEQLTLGGEPDRQAARRTRVQCRQIYSFARAVSLGWPNKEAALKMVERGLEHLNTKVRHPDGGWAQVLYPNGTIKNERRDLYDHAFIILAGAVAFEATGTESALSLAYEALDFIEAELVDPENGGWFEALPIDRHLRYADSHMHLLEALLSLYRVTGDPKALTLATHIVVLFETRFFDPSQDILCEHFAYDWQPQAQNEHDTWEPGHMYEWASLLHVYDEITGRDTLSWRQRMIRKADRDGTERVSGFAHNGISKHPNDGNLNRRIWPQIERFRARLLHPQTAVPGAADAEYRLLMQTYMDTMPAGTWLDETDFNGRPISKAIPASILYHAVTAFSALIETS